MEKLLKYHLKIEINLRRMHCCSFWLCRLRIAYSHKIYRETHIPCVFRELSNRSVLKHIYLLQTWFKVRVRIRTAERLSFNCWKRWIIDWSVDNSFRYDPLSIGPLFLKTGTGVIVSVNVPEMWDYRAYLINTYSPKHQNYT